jgi:hypothetical protein
MKLRFIAAGDALAHIPGAPYAVGQPSRYVGRKFVPPKDGNPAGYPATQEADEVELNVSRLDDAQRFARYVKFAQRGDIWPADAETAAACGVEYATASFKDGEWTRTSSPAVSPPHSTFSDKTTEKRVSRKESE